ncbi:MAG: DDE-type integrase/transposase/recombinase [Oscillospiraceae bacterium]|nr:DDE-type integrase/transposase/recombinase [Oscillospiraceae bacterium]
MDIITQNMRFRQSLMKYAEKNGVEKASRKYNKSRSYIYFWLKRWDGSIESLAEKSKKPHSHPNQHTEEEIKMIRNYRRRNPELGLTELWHRLRKKGYTRRPESLYRVMKKLGLLPSKPKPPKRQPKPYEQMTHPGERVQIDVKVVPRKCITDPEMKLYQYTAIDEYSRMRFLYGYEEQSTYSSADFAERVVKWFKRRGITVECIQTDNGFEFTNRFSTNRDKPTLFESTLERLGVSHKLMRPLGWLSPIEFFKKFVQYHWKTYNSTLDIITYLTSLRKM